MTRPFKPDICLFDLDYTLIDTDCELTWKNMLVDLGLAPAADRAKQQHYIDLHGEGQTPVDEYVAFFLREFVGQTDGRMAELARLNFERHIAAKIYREGRAAIAAAQAAGVPAVVLSGSNRVLVTPIAEALGASDLACTELELRAGRFTGALVGELCIRQGKVARAASYCAEHGTSIKRVAFHGDSVSDIPIFEAAGQATVVNPSARLGALAVERGWGTVRWSEVEG